MPEPTSLLQTHSSSASRTSIPAPWGPGFGGLFLVAQTVNNLPAMGREDPLENRMATHSSILAWRIPWTEEPGRLQSRGGHKESDTTEQLTLTFLTHSLQPGTCTWKNVEQVSVSVPVGSAHPDPTCCLHSRWCDDTGPTRSSGSAGRPPAAGSHRMISPGSSLPLQSPSAGCLSARCRAESHHHNTRGRLWWLVPGPQSAGRDNSHKKTQPPSPCRHRHSRGESGRRTQLYLFCWFVSLSAENLKATEGCDNWTPSPDACISTPGNQPVAEPPTQGSRKMRNSENKNCHPWTNMYNSEYILRTLLS